MIGAGIAGLCTTYALLKEGHSATLFDPRLSPDAHLPRNASALAGGMLAPYAEIEHMPDHWIEAGLEGISFWKDFSKANAIDFHQNGSLLIAHDEDRYILKRFEDHLPSGKKIHKATEEVEPALTTGFPNGLFLSEEAHLNPVSTLFALRETIKKTGGLFKAQKTSPGKLKSLYDHVIDCRGMGAESEEPDLRGVKGEIVIVRNTEFSLTRPVRLMHPRYPLYIVPRADHIFMIGATVIESAQDDHVSVRSGLELLSALYSLHTSFGEAQIVEILSGVRPSYSDNLPCIKVNDNVIGCNGLFRHGFLLSPVMGRCVADFIAGRENIFWPLLTKSKDHHEDYNQRKNKSIQNTDQH